MSSIALFFIVFAASTVTAFLIVWLVPDKKRRRK